MNRSRLRLLLLSGAFGAAICAASPVFAQEEASELIVRLNRLEGQLRQLSGQVEQLGHENRQLKEQLRKFSEDVEFRFQEQKGGRSASPPAAAAKPGRRSDAFDADGTPGAPGAPKPMGSTSAGRDGIAGLIEADRGGGGRAADPAPDTRGVAGLNPDFAKQQRDAGAAAPASGAKAQYDAAYAAYTQKQYGQAESGFRDFIRANPKDRLVGEATYWLGETYLRQNKPKDAAQQFLKVTQEHGKSGRAADAMLKLGISLSSLGAKEQACATFAELGRKYPSAAAHVKQGADREQKKAGCAV